MKVYAEFRTMSQYYRAGGTTRITAAAQARGGTSTIRPATRGPGTVTRVVPGGVRRGPAF